MPTLADILGGIDATKRGLRTNPVETLKDYGRGAVFGVADLLDLAHEGMTGRNPEGAAVLRKLLESSGTPVESTGANVGIPGLGTAATAAKGLTLAAIMGVPLKKGAGKAAKAAKYPDIYGDPKTLAREAASRVAPEDPLLGQLFGVSRDDLFDISKGGTREGNITERPFKAAKNPKGAASAREVMTPENEGRLINLIDAARGEPELFKGMASWYTMDPIYPHFVRLWGDKAPEMYKRYNAMTGMASPGSEVLTELNRGTAANMLAHQGRFGDFEKYAGMAEHERGADFPAELAAVIGHPYHSTAQAGPMKKYLSGGDVDMKSAKVPSYIAASGVPETGFQTAWPVGDAHWSRIVGLPDVRATGSTASASVPEMVSLAPWWRENIAAKSGLEAVPAQGVVWGAGSGATGVTSPIGAGKLELTAMQIGKAAKRLGLPPEQVRDMIILGRAHAGMADPELLAWLGGASALGAGAAAVAGSGDGEKK